MTLRERECRPKIEYRIRCNDDTHDHHRSSDWSTRDGLDRVVDRRNAGRLGFEACVPWRLEARVVGPWEDPADADELAAMLERDWWSWDEEAEAALVAAIGEFQLLPAPRPPLGREGE